ncbi:hypothetical protein QYF36_005820 [Acer negundo]|nr:hypothetical protein QYF36_005820 [Acer negundo]
MIRRRYLGNIGFAREFEDEERPFDIDVGSISSLYMLKCRYPRRGGRLDLGGGGGFVVLDREDGKWGSTLFNSYRPLLEGVEIDLEEQPSIYSTWWEAGSMCKGGGYGREADDQGFGFWSGGERRGQRPLFLFVI